MREALRTLRGILRSLRIYYGDRKRRAAMDRLYAQFVQPGDLVFDVGAHVGDRVAAFRRLGARVVAVEPQPALARTLRLLFCFSRRVTIEAHAVGREAGTTTLCRPHPASSSRPPRARRAGTARPGPRMSRFR
jgi:hypothetical protein